ncbi:MULTISPECIES: hypothetical protein [Acetobacter]|uniref:DUF2946 domain-containing protein n=3 Tax=Acetobacter TaxID=434 RepID=A0A2G4R9F7_9PROT|nr:MULTISPECIES: hypothetical protein [Acetobacter]BAU39805.1 hypothetical protein APT_10061 [Acetobacter pasteurianus NBRC 101655]ANA15323.1 hypothetical protein WG31_14495 [Acetobacter oryzifermentans]AXN01826.1 hypothetical protein CJF59_14460 [Acetobacter pomorum]KAA8392713.1 hypothetical protein FKW19_14730 [Acetobacter sp. DmW_125128]KAA8394135.1 hypothetical protein FKW22_10665 [Acetobacter sp. DmW_125124]
MARTTHPLHTLLKLSLVVVTLVGFLSLLALQSFAQPDELPRATIARLLGVDIAASLSAPDEVLDATSAGAGQKGSGLASPEGAVGLPTRVGPTQHHHMMAAHAHHMAAAIAGKSTQPHSGHHHGVEQCPLCPLLSLPAALPVALLLVPPPILRWMRRGSSASTPRAPPSVQLGLPPSRGPPA